MCHPNSIPPLSYTPITNESHIFNPTMDLHIDDQQLHRWPTLSEAIEEIKAIGKISGPTTITGLILYSRAMISMLFLGYLGDLELAGGSLAIGIANITGYSIVFGLAMAMDPICAQAYGANQMKLLGLTLQRTILLLLCVSIPIACLWFNIKPILLLCNQDEEISSVAQIFVAFAIPDLFFLSFLHPLRIYMRTQGVTLPLMVLSFAAILMHIPVNFLLVKYLEFGVAGVAIAIAVTDLNLVLFLCLFIWKSGMSERSWISPTVECLRGWSALLRLAVPTCVSVCLEWWWYELMIVLCGLLANPRATISSMGILIQTTSFIYVFPSALSLGVATRVGIELGAVGANINLGAFYLVGMPAAFVMGFGMKMGFRGLWVGLLAAQMCCAAAMVAVLLRTNWREEMERGREMRESEVVVLGKKMKKKKREEICDDKIIYRNDDDMAKSASLELEAAAPLIV